MHDLVNNRLFDVDFKMENQKYFVTLCCTTSKKGKKNTMQARKKLSNVYDEEAFKLWQCENWFTKFHC